MAWLPSHISPTRFAYEFVNEYQQIPPNATLNWVGNHSIGITFKPKELQTDYVLFHKGDPLNNPEANAVNNTLYCFVRNGYIYLRLFFASNINLFVRTTDQSAATENVTHFEYTWNDSTNELLLYVNGVSVQFDIIAQAGTYGDLASVGNAILFNSATTPFTFGYSLNDPQFEGIIYDAYLYRKARSGVEVNSTYNIVRDPSILTGGEKILFASTRFNNPASYDYYEATPKFQNITSFKTSNNGLYDLKALVSNNNTLNGTKITYAWVNVGVVVADRDGGNPVILNQIGPAYYSPTIKNDATELFYCRVNGATGLYSIYKSTINPLTNALSNEVLVKDTADSGYLAIDLSPDGTKIVAKRVHNPTGQEFIEIMNIDGSNPLTVQSFATPEDVYYPRYNRQNTMIVFSRRVTTPLGHRFKIFTMTNTGGNLRQIEGDSASAYAWSFSPDGQNIAYFTSESVLGYTTCYTMDINGRNRRHVSTYNNYNDAQPEWVAF